MEQNNTRLYLRQNLTGESFKKSIKSIVTERCYNNGVRARTIEVSKNEYLLKETICIHFLEAGEGLKIDAWVKKEVKSVEPHYSVSSSGAQMWSWSRISTPTWIPTSPAATTTSCQDLHCIQIYSFIIT